MSEDILKQAFDYYKQGDKQQARNLLAELIRKEPNNASAWYGLAICIDEPERKKYCLQKVVEIDPNNQKAKQALEKLNLVVDQYLDVSAANTSTQSTVVDGGEKVKGDVDQNKGSSSSSGKHVIIILAGASILLLLCVLAVGSLILPTGVKIASSLLATPTIQSTPTYSTEKEYALKMVPMLSQLAHQDKSITEYYDLLNSDSPKNESYNSTLEILEMGVLNNWSIVDYEDLTNTLTPVVLPKTIAVRDEVYDAASGMEAITPPASMTRYHNQIINCLNYRVDYFSYVISLIETNRTSEIENGSNVCDLYKTSLERISTFMQTNQ